MSDAPDEPGLPAQPHENRPPQEPQPGMAVPAAVVAAIPAPMIAERLMFTGDGIEYFKIWIVNVILSIVTLGIYSPWAKVRRLQYFYRNTRLADASFDYHGDPVAILKGRMIAAAMFFVYSAAGALSPFLAIAAFVGVACIMPWFLARSLRFRMHNSSYRGIRFAFSGSTGSAYWVFLGLPVLMVLSLFTLFPFWQQRLKRYQYSNTSYGQAPVAITAPVNEFYVTYVAAAAIMVGVFVAVGGAFLAAAAVGAASTNGFESGDTLPPAALLVMIPIFVLAGIIYLIGVTGAQAFVTVRLRNLVWNGLTLGSYRFRSDMKTWPFLWLVVTNLFGIVFTLGLFWPFAQVRMMRFFVSTLSIEGPESFAEFQAAASPDELAVGEEVSEFFDFDIGF